MLEKWQFHVRNDCSLKKGFENIKQTKFKLTPKPYIG